ncbi:MAG: TRAP transporter large permease [Verrucomicrobia bacterium]|nr:TRAP transporter large permease [Verrucomicrobiota bacterium]
MDASIVILIVSFLLLLALNVPVAVGICLATFVTISVTLGSAEIAAKIIAQKMATGINSFSLLAIPFFILSGLLMGRGGIAGRLIEFASALVGRFKGGLGYVNVLTCMLFGAISGSAAAAVSSIGGFMIPEMNRKGYNNEFNVAVTTTAATTGLLIPPSNIMIVYALVSGGTVSIATLFIAGILPGILFGFSLMAVIRFTARARDYGSEESASLAQIWKSFRRAFLSLLMIVVVLGGILRGVFTPTEAAAVSVAYAFVLSVIVYRKVRTKDLPEILLQSGITTSVVFLLIGTSMAMSWILAIENIPQTVSTALLNISDNKFVILLLINLILLCAGAFMDMTPAVLIFTPIFWPAAKAFGMDPVHFGIMLIANLCIGLCTPPVGTCLFVGCGVGKTTLAKVTPKLIPFYYALGVSLLLITYIPAISLAIPRLLGLN